MYISIIVTLSRQENVDLMVEQLPKLIEPGYIYELIVAIDNNMISKFNTEMKIGKLGIEWRNVNIYNTGRQRPGRTNIRARRERIAKTMNEIKEHIGGSSFVFGFEDDTVLPEHPIGSLRKAYQLHKGPIGFVEGRQVGRWGYKYIGAWRVDDLKTPDVYTTIPYTEEQTTDQIDAGGFYCFLTPTNLFKSIELKVEEPVGPDVYYGLELRRRGFDVLVDNHVDCGHKSDEGEILWPDKDCVQVELSIRDNRWHNKVISEVEING